MSQSLSTLSRRLEKRGERFEKDANRSMRKVVVKAHYVYAEGVPVDTGEARSNTRGTSARTVPRNVIPPYAPGKKLGRGETGNLNAANAQCARAARVWKASSGKPFVIFNNWPEISRLNNGQISAQGSHFKERAARVLRNEIRKVKWIR